MRRLGVFFHFADGACESFFDVIEYLQIQVEDYIPRTVWDGEEN